MFNVKVRHLGLAHMLQRNNCFLVHSVKDLEVTGHCLKRHCQCSVMLAKRQWATFAVLGR